MAKLIKVDFSEMLGEGQYVEIRDPKFIPWGDKKRMVGTLKEDDMSSRLDMAEALVIMLVRNGNISDEDGNPITIPFSVEDIARVPAQVVEHVSSTYAELQQGNAVPKK